jgi:hypothetical protein
MRDDLVNIFIRDWKSSKLVEDVACQCQIMGWPLKTLAAPDMLSHYFLSTPNGGLSSTQVESVMNILGKDGLKTPKTAIDFCNKTCFKQNSGDLPLPDSSCFSINSDETILLQNSPPIFLGKNSHVNKDGKVVETEAYFKEGDSLGIILLKILLVVLIIVLIYVLVRYLLSNYKKVMPKK